MCATLAPKLHPAIVDLVRVAIDVRKINDFGIGTYVRNLVNQLARIDQETEYLLLCGQSDVESVERLGENFQAVTELSGQYSIREQVSIPSKLLRLAPQVFHTPHYVLPALTPCRSIVTIHDCIHLVFPQYLKGRIARIYARSTFWTAVNRASRILTVSEASKRDILRFFSISPDKVTVIHNAIAEHFFKTPSQQQLSEVRERYQLNHRFIMYAGNVKPHKNLERLIDAFVLLREIKGNADLRLLITGSEISKYTTLRRAVHRYNLHKYVRFLGYQTERTLATLYRLADVFVFPSLYEGFGLPPLEAMASGTPVVVSRASSLPEVVGDSGVMVNPYDAISIADGVQTVLADNNFTEDLKKRGLARARTFSWVKSVERIHRIYQEVAEVQ